jgi:hypothetical protein
MVRRSGRLHWHAPPFPCFQSICLGHICRGDQVFEFPIAKRYLNVDSLENIAQIKETELVKISKEYGDYTSNLKVNWKDVQANLQDKDVAIEFVEYPTLTDTVKYAALVLRKGWQYPKFIPLFRKDEIEGFIKQDKNRIYSNHDHIGKQLRKLIGLHSKLLFHQLIVFTFLPPDISTS